MGKNETIEQLAGHFLRENIRNVVILTDKNVDHLYGDYFSELSEQVMLDKLVLRPGEKTKSIRSAAQIWEYLADKQYDKDVFLLNFGGGMVCDLGGFVASTYKRGIRFANCPTTLLAMIDAAIGGKTGVNLPSMKNGAGTIYFPEIQLPVDLSFLNTLHINEFFSGLGELLKYALISSADLFHSFQQRTKFPSLTMEDVDFCIGFKMKVVREDPHDKGIRHILNFGHTFGHAIESYAAKTGKPVAHGLAVAQGLYYESLLSTRLGHLPQEEWQQIAAFLKKHFAIMPITDELLKELLHYMLNDKKNHDDMINFTLLDQIGHAIPDFQLPASELLTYISHP